METPSKGPRAPKYTRGIVQPPPEGTPAPEAVFKAPSADGGLLEVLLWGDGSLAAPYALQIRHKSPTAPNRFPTWEEIHEAVVELLPEGVGLQIPALEVNAANWEIALAGLDNPAGWTMIPLIQMGVRPGSPAAIRHNIITTGEHHGRPGA